MRYSERPSYLAIEVEGQPWVALYILFDVAYFSSLLGGIISVPFWVLWPVFRAAKRQNPYWILALGCGAATLVVAVVVFNLSRWGMQRLFARFDVKDY